jgi:hypothetical protein
MSDIPVSLDGNHPPDSMVLNYKLADVTVIWHPEVNTNAVYLIEKF